MSVAGSGENNMESLVEYREIVSKKNDSMGNSLVNYLKEIIYFCCFRGICRAWSSQQKSFGHCAAGEGQTDRKRF